MISNQQPLKRETLVTSSTIKELDSIVSFVSDLRFFVMVEIHSTKIDPIEPLFCVICTSTPTNTFFISSSSFQTISVLEIIMFMYFRKSFGSIQGFRLEIPQVFNEEQLARWSIIQRKAYFYTYIFNCQKHCSDLHWEERTFED